MKRSLILIFFACVVGACGVKTPTSEGNSSEALTVSAAVSLRDAFNEIGAIYKAKSGGDVAFNFGASGALQKQIETGAPVDIFASAGEKQMDDLAAKNGIENESRRDFARNSLVLIVPPDSKLNIGDFPDLTKADVKRIAVGNPKTVPAGQYTAQVFEKINATEGLQAKLVLAEDVRQVLDYVARGEVDAGIVYATDARVAAEKVRTIATAREEMHGPILYPIAIVRDAKQKKAAEDFVNLVLSTEGQAVLQKYGFGGAANR